MAAPIGLLEILPSRDDAVRENAQAQLKRINVQVNATTVLVTACDWLGLLGSRWSGL